MPKGVKTSPARTVVNHIKKFYKQLLSEKFNSQTASNKTAIA